MRNCTYVYIYIYICILQCVHIYIYIYTYTRCVNVITASVYASGMSRARVVYEAGMHQGTHRVITLSGEKGTPWHFWGDKSRLINGSTPKVPLSKNMKFAVTQLVLTRFVPFRDALAAR